MAKVTLTLSDGALGIVDLDTDLDDVLAELVKDDPDGMASLAMICAVGIRELFSCGYVIDAGHIALGAAEDGEDSTKAVREAFVFKE